MAACPYDAIFINPEDGAAEKCNFCAQRIDIGLEPACVVVCPTEAILVGDLNDTGSPVTRIVGRESVSVRRPEKETHPKLFYRAGHQATLDPLAARRPTGGLFMWSQQGGGPEMVTSGHPGPQNSAAAALLAYDVPHRIPWDWEVSLYTWTKSLAAGMYLVAGALAFVGTLPHDSALFTWAAPLLSLVFLAVTGGLLIGDLEHPERFYLMFTRPQWRSWLVRGAVILTAYGLALAMHLALPSLRQALLLPGLVLAALTAVYTAYLFAQAKARDLWQSPLLPPHLLVQAILAGGAAQLLLARRFEGSLLPALAPLTAIAAGVHLLLVIGEVTLTHATAHARLAVREMTHGRYRTVFWSGVGLSLLAAAAPVLGLPPALLATAALAGLLCHEHAYVQAGQSVPLA
jgi:formate-dependent nitrite reductase membrane component NrfD